MVLAASGTTTVMLVSVATGVAAIAATAPVIATVVAPTTKPEPVIVTVLPATPLAGATVVMIGGWPFTVRPPTPPAKVTVPPRVVTATAVSIGASVVPLRLAGITAVMVVSLITVNEVAA